MSKFINALLLSGLAGRSLHSIAASHRPSFQASSSSTPQQQTGRGMDYALIEEAVANLPEVRFNAILDQERAVMHAAGLARAMQVWTPYAVEIARQIRASLISRGLDAGDAQVLRYALHKWWGLHEQADAELSCHDASKKWVEIGKQLGLDCFLIRGTDSDGKGNAHSWVGTRIGGIVYRTDSHSDKQKGNPSEERYQYSGDEAGATRFLLGGGHYPDKEDMQGLARPMSRERYRRMLAQPPSRSSEPEVASVEGKDGQNVADVENLRDAIEAKMAGMPPFPWHSYTNMLLDTPAWISRLHGIGDQIRGEVAASTRAADFQALRYAGYCYWIHHEGSSNLIDCQAAAENLMRIYEGVFKANGVKIELIRGDNCDGKATDGSHHTWLKLSDSKGATYRMDAHLDVRARGDLHRPSEEFYQYFNTQYSALKFMLSPTRPMHFPNDPNDQGLRQPITLAQFRGGPARLQELYRTLSAEDQVARSVPVTSLNSNSLGQRVEVLRGSVIELSLTTSRSYNAARHQIPAGYVPAVRLYRPDGRFAFGEDDSWFALSTDRPAGGVYHLTFNQSDGSHLLTGSTYVAKVMIEPLAAYRDTESNQWSWKDYETFEITVRPR